jgi:hypothetical protein
MGGSKCPNYLPAALGLAAALLASMALEKERSPLESASVKAATDCVAQAALNNSNIVQLYRDNRLKEVTDWIVLKSSACDNPLRAMRLLHDKLYGEGTGRKFLLGDYLADLPRAVRERIKNEIDKNDGSGSPPSSSKKTHAQTYFVTHNDSQMRMQIGNAKEGISRVKIYYDAPNEKISQLVNRGDLFFDGSLQWDTGEVVGRARVYKWGCEALEYQVKGTVQFELQRILNEERNVIDSFELEGWAPTYGDGCRFAGFAWNHNATLTFEPLAAHVPVSPMRPPPAASPPPPGPPPLGWVNARYVDCQNWPCFVRVSAAGANVRTHPNGQTFLALINGTPLDVSQRQGEWALVTATCNLVPTGLWSYTHGVPLDTCQRVPNQPPATQPPTNPVPSKPNTPEACRKFPELCN